MRKIYKRFISWVLCIFMVVSLFSNVFPVMGAQEETRDYVSLVNTWIESNRGRYFFYNSTRNPFGMINPRPDDYTGGAWGSGYRHNSNSIVGISHIQEWQISGLQIMPTAKKFIDPSGGAESWRTQIDHNKETAEPGYHQLKLEEYGINLELTATDRVAMHRYTYDQAGPSEIFINLSPGNFGEVNIFDAYVEEVGDHHDEIRGWFKERGVLSYFDTTFYFSIKFDTPYDELRGWKDGRLTELTDGKLEGSGMGVYAHYNDLAANQQVQLKVSTSLTGVQGAEKNMDLELDHWDFDKVKEDAQAKWNEMLGRIDVKGGTQEEQVKFYTDLFHILCGRTKISDADGKYLDNTWGSGTVRQVPLDSDGKPEFNMYNYDALWLSQWTLNTVWGMAYPEIYEEFVQSQLQMYQDGGLLPRGPSAGNYTLVMTSAPVIPFIASAYNKGIRGYDIDLAYEAMVDAASVGGLYDKSGYEYRTWDGTGGAYEYITKGYVPHDMPGGEYHNDGASNTMEFSFEDYALSQIAKQIGAKGVNIAQFADVQVSSVQTGPNSDYFSGERAIDGRPRRSGFTTERGAYNVEWASEQTDPTITLSWDEPHEIDRIVISDRLDGDSNVNAGVLTFSDGTSMEVTGVPTDGSDHEVRFEPRSVTWVKFEITGGTGSHVGLNEFEVWDTCDAYAYYLNRSANWKNLYDASTGFIRPKDGEGNWMNPFNPLEGNQNSSVSNPGGDFCEANSWQYTFFATHDVLGLANLMGGKAAYSNKLNEAFEKQAPDFAGSYGQGYISYGNQPGVFQAHLFNYVGRPWLTQYWTREVRKQIYSGTSPDNGYGNHDEDQGHMSCVSLLMAMGLFEVSGGVHEKPVYDITAPIFDEITIQLHPDYYSGGEFKIIANNASEENVYIQSAQLNGTPLNNCWFYHEDFAKGGTLELTLGDTPNKEWGVDVLPPSVSASEDVLISGIKLESQTVTDLSANIQLEAEIFPENATYQELEWTVTDLAGRETSLAEIVQGDILSLNALPGQVLVTAETQDGSGLSAYAIITIAPDRSTRGGGLKADYYTIDRAWPGTGNPYPYGLTEDHYISTHIGHEINFEDFRPQLEAYAGNADFAGVRWTGFLVPETSGEYSFSVTSDDGVVLKIDDKTMIDFWCPNSGEPELSQGTIHLEAGRFYPIQCDYFQGDYEAKIQLSWSVDGSDYEVIPATSYYLPDGYTPSESRAEAVTISSDQKTTLISEGDTLSLQASVTPKEAPQKVIWSAASPAGGVTEVLDIDEKGVVTGKKPGTAIVYAYAADGSGQYGSIPITVEEKGQKDQIQITHDGVKNVSFGLNQEAKRYQGFIAREGYTNLEAVTIKLTKIGNPDADLILSLYKTDENGKPTGSELYRQTVNAADIQLETPFTIPVNYSGLIPGETYAIVLGTNKLDDNNFYSWYCSAYDISNFWEPSVYNPQIQQDGKDLFSGKMQNDVWVDESRLGDMYLIVSASKEPKEKRELSGLVEESKGLLDMGWTEESQKRLQEALLAAEEALADASSPEVQVTKALTELKTALSGLSREADRSDLEKALEDSATYKESDYLASSFAAFASAVEQAETLLQNSAASQRQIDDALQSLKVASNLLIQQTADKTTLLAVIASAKERKEEDYTPESYAKFQEKLAAAESVATLEAPLVSQVENAQTALEDAVKALVPNKTTVVEIHYGSQTNENAVTGRIANYTDSNMAANVIVAVYDDLGILEEVYSVEYPIGPGESADVNVAYGMPGEQIEGTVKTFVWEKDTNIPMCSPYLKE